jgi:hypothetical protein
LYGKIYPIHSPDKGLMTGKHPLSHGEMELQALHVK